MPTLGAPLEFSQLEARNIRIQNLTTAPAAPLPGQMYYSSSSNALFWWDGTTWIPAGGAAVGGPPAGPAGGSLAGTYPDPTIAPGVITDVEVAGLNKDGLPAAPSMRTLGPGPQQAAPGNDARFGAPAPPNGAAGGSLTGTYPDPTIAAGVITDVEVAAANKDGLAALPGMRTLAIAAQAAMPGDTTLDAITPPAGPVNMNGQLVNGVTDPAAPQDAATKAYVDNVVAGLDVHDSVRAATTADQALTGNPTIDGIAVADGDRVLVKANTAPAENGIYDVLAAGWTRSTDADAWDDLVAAYVFVEEGTIAADAGYVCTIDAGGTLGTDPIAWTQFSGAASAPPVGGAGLTATGNQLDVIANTDATIVVNADDIQLGTVLEANMGDASVDLASATVTGVLPIAAGGTSGATAPAARTALGTPGFYSTSTHAAGTTISIPQATHGLTASSAILTQVQDAVTGAVEIPDIVVAATGDVTITYGNALTANAKQIVLVG